MQMSKQLRQRYDAMQAERDKAAKQVYAEENDYAKLKLSFPAAWHVEHKGDTAALYSPEGVRKFGFAEVKKGDPAGYELVSTSTWNGLDTKVYRSITSSTVSKVVDVYTHGYVKTKTVIRFDGDEETFDAIWKSLELKLPE
jgi:hypothetical protein